MRKDFATMPWRLAGVRVLTAVAVLLVPATALADSRDHDAVRRAVERGEVRPLAEILERVRDKLPGEVIGVEIERKDGRWLYEFRAVDRRGRLFEVYVDGNSGAIERVKEK
jgi:uncharacterized membrane protein YkoI